ncbi:hypothetical protein SANTM175S_07013 [Streptomyces antimycoticus]
MRAALRVPGPLRARPRGPGGTASRTKRRSHQDGRGWIGDADATPAGDDDGTHTRPAHSSSAKGRCSAGSDQKPVVRAQSGRSGAGSRTCGLKPCRTGVGEGCQ